MLIISATAFCKLPRSSLYAANSCTLSRRYNASFAVTVTSDELLSLASSSSAKSESVVSYLPLTTSSTHSCRNVSRQSTLLASTSSHVAVELSASRYSSTEQSADISLNKV